MNAQYRLKEDWKPVGTSRAAKKLADWMNAIAKQLNRAEVVSGGTARPTDMGFRIEVDGVGNFPFKLTHSDSAIRVEQGTWTRHDNDCTFTPDSGKTYKSITALDDSSPFGSGTYIVYIALEDSTGNFDPHLGPDSIGVYAGTSLPVDQSPLSGNRYMQIGTATADGGDITGITQTRWGGNIDDICYIADTDSSYAQDPNDGNIKRYHSVELCPTAGRGVYRRTLQIFGWDSATAQATDPNDLLVGRDDSDINKQATYFSIQSIWDDFDPTNSGSTIGDWLNDNRYIKHNRLDFTADTIDANAYANTDHDYRYPEPDTPANGTDANAGIFSFTNATAAGSGAGAIKITGGLYAGNGAYITDATSAVARLGYIGFAGRFTATGSVVEVCDHGTSGRAIDVVTGSYYHAGNQGVTGDGFSGGIKTDDSAFRAGVEAQIQDILVGHGGLL